MLRLGFKDELSHPFESIGHKEVPRNVQGVLFSDTLVAVVFGQVWLFLGELDIGDTLVINVVDECSENQSEASERIRCQTVREVMDLCCHMVSSPLICHRLSLHGREVRRDHSTKKLGHRHGDMASMLKVVKLVGSIRRGDHRHIVSYVVGDCFGNGNEITVQSGFRDLGIEVRGSNRFLYFIQAYLSLLALEVYVTIGVDVGRTSLVDDDDLLDLFDKNFAYPVDNTCIVIIHVTCSPARSSWYLVIKNFTFLLGTETLSSLLEFQPVCAHDTFTFGDNIVACGVNQDPLFSFLKASAVADET